MKAIPRELQHWLVVTDIDKRKFNEVTKNEQTFRRVWKLKENNMETKFQERLKKSVNLDAPNLWNTIKNFMPQAYDEVGRKKKSRKNHGDT